MFRCCYSSSVIHHSSSVFRHSSPSLLFVISRSSVVHHSSSVTCQPSFIILHLSFVTLIVDIRHHLFVIFYHSFVTLVVHLCRVHLPSPLLQNDSLHPRFERNRRLSALRTSLRLLSFRRRLPGADIRYSVAGDGAAFDLRRPGRVWRSSCDVGRRNIGGFIGCGDDDDDDNDDALREIETGEA